MPKKGYKQTLEHREKISEARMGEKNPMYGKPSPMRGRFGKDNPLYGRKFPEKSAKQRGKKYPEKSKKITGEGNPNWKGGLAILICKQCGKPFPVKQNQKKTSKFCTMKCYHLWTIGKDNPNWQGGTSFEPYGLEFNKQLKEQVRKRDNYICQECGYTEKQLDYRLSIHHIDFDKENNNSSNLISLCKSCHSKTVYNRKKWTEYYKEKICQNGFG